MKNGKVVVEIEEVAIGSDTLSFDEYVELRLFALIIKVTKSGTIFAPLFKFLKEENLDTFQLMYDMLKQPNIASKKLQNLFDEFKHDTINELWDSPEEIENNYQKNEEYEKFIPDHPFLNINSTNLYDKLSALISDKNNIKLLKNKSIDWVKSTHDIHVVGESLYQYYEQL